MSAPTEDGPDAGAEDLVAYLDHELDPAAGEQLERRLAEDATLRKELTRFENVWEALDSLPRASVNDAFTHKTVEMVAQAAEADLRETGKHSAKSYSRTWLWGLGLFALSAVVAFVVVQLRWPNPNRDLIEVLPVVENLEQYRAAGDIDFLRELDKRGVFPDSSESAP